MLAVVRVMITDAGCVGMLLKDNHPFCWTLEDPEKMLALGQYKIAKKGNQLEILSSNGPSFFTVGHTKDEADGNILLGFKVYSPRYLTESSKALAEFQKVVKNLVEDTLDIRRLV
jgi:hypothetical protein